MQRHQTSSISRGRPLAKHATYSPFFDNRLLCLFNTDKLFATRRERPISGGGWPPDKSVYWNIIFLISQPKHVVGTQKNCLKEIVLLST